MSIKGNLERILIGELDNCTRAIRDNDVERSRRELREAIVKLEGLKSSIGRLEQAARRDNKF